MGSSRPFVPFLVLALALLASFAVPLAAGKIVIDTSNHKKQSVDVCIAQSLGNEYLQYYESAKVIGLSTAGTTSNEAIPDVNKQLNNYRQPNLTPETDLRELIKGNKLTQAAFQKYAYGLIPFAAPGIALGALSLIFMLFFISESRLVGCPSPLHSFPLFCVTSARSIAERDQRRVLLESLPFLPALSQNFFPDYSSRALCVYARMLSSWEEGGGLRLL